MSKTSFALINLTLLALVALCGHLEDTAFNFATQMWWGTLRTGLIGVAGAAAYHFYLTRPVERNS